ncbi:MAG: LexA family transcriptional regulator [Methylocystaceae bacterium]|nr:LexA family transcriptional regulator [Methylocystaceae bacterium]
MNDSLQSRLKEIAKESGGNRALCDKSGVSERTFANWLSGASEPKIIGLAAIAETASVTLDWLVRGTKPKEQLGARHHDQIDIVRIPCLSSKLKDHTNGLHRRLSVQTYRPFSTDFLKNRLQQTNFDQLCLLEVMGDCLAPTANHGDFVLIDRAQNQLSDGLCAFVFKGVISIKRIVRTLDGINVISDNQTLYPAHMIPNEELAQLDVIGRAIWISKTVL